MVTLIYYELKKVFSASFLKIALVLLLILNVVFCVNYTDFRTFSAKRSLIESAFEEYSSDPVSFIQNYKDYLIYLEENTSPANPDPADPYRLGGREWEIRDGEIYETVLAAAKSDGQYEEKLSLVLDKAYNIRNRLEQEKGFAYEYQTRVIQVYSSLKDTVVFQGEPVFGWDILFSYESDYFPVFLLVIFCTAFLSLSDQQNGFYVVGGVCRKGRGATVAAKLSASLFLSFVIVCLFSITTFLTVGIVSGGYSNPLEAIQAIDSFVDLSMFPYAQKMWSGYLFVVFFKCFSAFCLTGITFAVSVITKRFSFSIPISLGVVVFCWFLPKIKNTSQWNYLGLRALFSPSGTLKRYRAVDIFDVSWNITDVFFVFSIITIAFSLALSLWYYPKIRQHTKKFKRLRSFFSCRELFVRRKKRTLSLFLFEGYKNRFLLLLIFVLLVLKVWTSSVYFQEELSSYDRVYRNYIEGTIGGSYTEEKAEKIRRDILFYAGISSRYEEMSGKYLEGTIENSEFISYLREYSVAEVKLRVLADLDKQSAYLETLYKERGIIGSYLYDTGFNRLTQKGADGLLICFVSLLAMQLYLNERKDSEKQLSLLKSTKLGRLALFKRKMLLCTSTTVTLWFLFLGIDLCYLTNHFAMPPLSEPLVSISSYGNAPMLSVFDYLFLWTLLRFVGILLLCFLSFLIAFFIKKRLLSYIVGALIWLPYFATEAGVSLATAFDLTRLENPDVIVREGGLGSTFLFFGFSVAIVAVGMTVVTKKVKRGDGI
ncbi:MAG: hypothetical protein IJC84_05975 [Clostridia bacterium]|nr:hypothetical protein [Clostridia bacterium]